MEDLPFAPTTLTAVLADLAFVMLLAGGPMLLRWVRASQTALQAYYRAHTTAGERAVLDGLARDAVAWAEQFAQSAQGQAKFQQAMTMVQVALKRRGISLDMREIEAAVQSAWAEMPKAKGAQSKAG